MGYRVYYLLKNQMTHEDYKDATNVEARQNHLYVIDMRQGEVLAVYQSGWWIKAVKIKDGH